MKLVSSKLVILDAHISVVEHEGETYTVTDYYNEGKIIDSTYRDSKGNELDNPALIEELDEFTSFQKP